GGRGGRGGGRGGFARRAGGQGRGRALRVAIRGAADVAQAPLDRPAGEPVRPLPRVVVGDRRAAVAPHAQALAGQLEVPWLVLDARLADLPVPVVQRQGAGRHAGRVLAVLVERRRHHHALPR